MDKELSILVAGRAVQALLSIVALRAMTAFLSPAEAGNYFLLLSFATGFSFFLVNPVGMYLNRRLHAWQENRVILHNFSLFNLYLLAVALVALFCTAAGKVIIGSGPGLPVWPFAFSVAAYVYCSTWNMTLIPALNMLGYRVGFVVLTILTTGAGLFFSLLAVKYVRAVSFYWISGQTAAMCALAIGALYALKNKIGESFTNTISALRHVDKNSFASVKAFAVPLSGAALFMWVQTQGYRLIVEAKAGAEFLGYMAVGLGIAASLAAVSESLVQQIYYPGFYRNINSSSRETRGIALSMLAAKSLPVYVILMFFTVSLSGPLTGLLVDRKFTNAAPFIVFGAFIELFRMTANILASAAHSEMRTKILIKPYLYGGLVLCAGTYAAAGSPLRTYLIPSAMVAGGAVTLLVMRVQVSGVVSVKLDWELLTKTALAAAPMLGFLAFRHHAGPLISFVVVVVAGIYFLALQYLVAFRWTPKSALATIGTSPAEKPAGENAEGAAYE